MKVGVYGFYHSKNLGDDAFVEAIKVILGQEGLELDFLRASEMTLEQAKMYQALVIGGGEI